MITPDRYFTVVPKSINMEIRSELTHTNEFTFAVAVILSAQATDKKVNEVTPALFAAAPTPEKMVALGIDGIKKYISQISFFNNKAKNIFALSEKLAEYKTDNNQWVFPKKYHNRDELMKLPGIGQKTANVIMNVLWGAPNIGVDTHVFRNAHRYGWVGDAENTPEKVEAKLLTVIPKKYHAIVNHVMVLHGRYICRAISPKCGECPVAKWCECKDKKI
ncbi:MAG: endonuclease III [Alphaproteobacteria bacterium]|nr:endonuclease III [Alphaproteobacteria bacterium]